MEANVLINLKTSEEVKTKIHKQELFFVKLRLGANNCKAHYENGVFYQLSGNVINKDFIRSYWFLNGEMKSKEFILDLENLKLNKLKIKYILL